MQPQRVNRIEVAEKLLPFLTTPKRLKIAVGGRGGSKSIFFGDAFLRFCDAGERLCCAREYQNTIEDSVHALLSSRVATLGVATIQAAANKIHSQSGGEIFYRGLARNITGFKSAFGINRIWIEEGQGLSQETIDTVLPTIREEDSEIWISANRGSSKDPFSKSFLNQYERALDKDGYYEDDDILIIEINWWDNPFFPDTLNQQRLRDKANMSAAKYDHVWNGEYSDTVENAIIEPDWFDACVDAHKVLGFKPEGIEVVSFDPFDGGEDAAGLVHRHGSVIVEARESRHGRVNDCCDWALSYVQNCKPDAFIWDAGGVGAGLKRQITDALAGKSTSITMFEGQSTVDLPNSQYEPSQGTVMKAKTNRETFYNRRAQRYWNLRDRVYKTYLAVKDRQYTDPSNLISFSSGIDVLSTLRAELCRVPLKTNGAGKIQIMSKPEMKAEGIDSPNLGDCAMMSMDITGIKVKVKKINFAGWNQ